MKTNQRFEWPHDKVGFLNCLLDTIEYHIVPLTRSGVVAGNKVFGAALLRKSDLSLLLAETNNETANPLWHGEMHCLKKFYELPNRPDANELIFLSTHEPCSLCLSAITWAGFDNFFYFFSYQSSRDQFAIPYDLKILDEVFGIHDGGYRRRNDFWTSFSIRDEITQLAEAQRTPLVEQSARLDRLYDGLSDVYQKQKGTSAIPLK